jgi:hypothetical protein
MARPEHNTYDFSDDIETVFDVDDDIETLTLLHGYSTKKEYLEDIRGRHLGTDRIYAELSAFYLDIDNKLSDYYYNKVSKGYYKIA